MSDLQSQFENAVADTQQLNTRPDNASLLRLYALYKQATQGDAGETRPGAGDMVGRAKWDAWKRLQGTASPDAMQAYIDLVATLA